MKKLLSLTLSLIIMLSAIGVSATEVVEEFNIDDAMISTYRGDDEAVLMEVGGKWDVYAELEKRLVEAWTNMTPDDPDTDGVKENAVYISDLKIEKTDIEALYALAFFENPLFYYVERGFSGATVRGESYMGYVIPRYIEPDKSVIEAKWAEYDKATEEILLYISSDMTDFEKVMAVHDYMVFNYKYDITDTDQTMEIILDKVGVCAAYAEVFQHVMNTLGIECTVVRANEMGHIWNLVKLDGEWYHMDVTWNDNVPEEFAGVNHKFALLSTAAIESLGHYGFEMAGYEATSTLYDNAAWRDDRGALVTLDGVMYRVEGNDLVDENGNVIYENLDGGDGKWNLSKTTSLPGNVFAGVCEINGILYFNTDEGVHSYNPETKAIETVVETYGACGIYADFNVLRYSTYDTVTYTFVEAGELRISDIKLAEPYFENGEAVVRLYNDSDEPLWVISQGDTYKLSVIAKKGVNTVRFENGEEQTIYIWKNSMEPYFEKIVINE